MFPTKGKEVSYVVEINVDPPIVSKHKISYGICALDWLGVVIERAQEPGILRGDEFTGFGVRPQLNFIPKASVSMKLDFQSPARAVNRPFGRSYSTYLVFVIGMQIYTTPLRFPPMLRDAVVDISLVNDFGY